MHDPLGDPFHDQEAAVVERYRAERLGHRVRWNQVRSPSCDSIAEAAYALTAAVANHPVVSRLVRPGHPETLPAATGSTTDTATLGNTIVRDAFRSEQSRAIDGGVSARDDHHTHA